MDLQQQHEKINILFREGSTHHIQIGQVWQSVVMRFSHDRFYLITAGKCTIWINGKEHIGAPGQLFFIPAGTPCGYINDTARPYSLNYIHFELIPHNLDLISLSELPYCVDVGLDGQVSELFNSIYENAKLGTISAVFQTKIALYSLLVEYIRLAGAEQSRLFYGRDTQSEYLLNYIQRNLRKDLSNETLAKRMHMELRSYIRYFKRITGYTPANYILQLRLSTAKAFLEESELSISEIVQKVGISEPAYFSKMFKKYYSLSPRAYREMIRRTVQIPPNEK